MVDSRPPDATVRRLLLHGDRMGKDSQPRRVHNQVRGMGHSLPRVQRRAVRVYRVSRRRTDDPWVRNALRLDSYDHKHDRRDPDSETEKRRRPRCFRRARRTAICAEFRLAVLFGSRMAEHRWSYQASYQFMAATKQIEELGPGANCREQLG